MDNKEKTIERMNKAFKRENERRERFDFMKANPSSMESRLTRFFVFLFVMLAWGTFFMILLNIASLFEGGWSESFKYMCYGSGAIVGYRISKHENVFNEL